MNPTRIICTLIGISQLALGGLYLFAPAFFINWQGLDPIPADTAYPLAMLAGRFLVYGIGMFVIARNPQQNMFWLNGMVAIQVIDLLAGIFYVGTGVVPLEVATIAMFDAALFIALLLYVRASQQGAANA